MPHAIHGVLTTLLPGIPRRFSLYKKLSQSHDTTGTSSTESHICLFFFSSKTNGNFLELNLLEISATLNTIDDLLLFEVLSSFDLSDTQFPMSLVVPFTGIPFSA